MEQLRGTEEGEVKTKHTELISKITAAKIGVFSSIQHILSCSQPSAPSS